MSSVAAIGSAASGPSTPAIFTRTFMFGIMGTLSMILASWEKADRIRDNYFEGSKDVGDTFDFIVVGGGTAGSIVANRLSEKYKVLLLEAGGDPHPFQAVPLLSNYLLNYAELDWRHVTMPQKQAFRGSIQNRASISQGRGLGGTSNLDYLVYLRGHPLDYENWAEITEDEGWTYSNLVEHFKILESYIGPWKGDHHGDVGEMTLRQPSYSGLGKQFCEAVHQNGYPTTDLNNVFTEGCDIVSYPSRKGYRDSAYSAFIKPIKKRWSLVVAKYAHVNKVLIRANDNFAHGVEYDRHGQTKTAFATKEIILSGGALQTPKLLMLSGIGPKADLNSVGIPLIADLPVGKTLQDHLSVFLGPFFVDRGKALNIDDVSTGAVLSLSQNSGPLTTTGFQATALISSGLEKLHGTRNWPDLQFTMYGLGTHKSAAEDFSHAYRLNKTLLESYLEHAVGHDTFSIVISGARPKSTGTVKLLNRNPYAPLIINPNYFDKIYDVVVMVDGVKKALRFVENSTSLYHNLHARFTGQVLPSCEKYRYRSDAYFECYVRTMSVSLGNIAATAPMGAVLNSKLQVKGVKGLRVIDASSMPSITSTSTTGATMVIAERGSDLILTEWKGAESEADVLKESNSANEMINKIKESSDQIKSELDSLKLASSKPSASASSVKAKDPLDFNDLQKFTKTMGSLAALLDPVLASASDNLYTGSFAGNAGKGENKTFSPAIANPFATLLPLAPKLKGQVGGLYQNLFADFTSSPGKVQPGNKGSGNGVLKDIIKLSLTPETNTINPMKLIEEIIQNGKLDLSKLQNITIPDSFSIPKPPTPKNITLEDVFGISDGIQEELEEYEIDENNSNSTTTQKAVKIVTVKPVTVYSKPWTSTKPTTTTTKATTTTKTTTTTTTKRPLIDYTYEMLPVPLTKSKGHFTHSASPVFSKPGEPKNQLTPPAPPSPKPLRPYRPRPQSGPISQKLKNLEALAQIQHETLSKIKNKLRQPFNSHSSPNQHPPQPGPLNSHYKNVYNKPGSSQFLNPAFPPQQQTQNFKTPPQHGQHFQGPPQQHGQHFQGNPQHHGQGFQGPPQQHGQGFHGPPQHHQQGFQGPPQHHQQGFHGPPQQHGQGFQGPPPNGQFPPQQYQNHQPPPSQYNHPLHGQMLKSVPTPPPPPSPFPAGHPLYDPRAQPGSILRPFLPTPITTVDPTDLKYAVNSIMNAKYQHSSSNPFSGIMDMLGKAAGKEATTDSGVLKALQLRANVDKYIHLPSSFARPSPIPITHRPTRPPPTQRSTTPEPPQPFGPEELHKQQEQEGDIFAPIKDVFQPLTKLMKAPFDLISNPFKTETNEEPSLTGSITKTLASGIKNGITSGLSGSLTGGLTSGLASTLTSSITSGISTGLGLTSGLTSGLTGGLLSGGGLTESLLPDIFQKRTGPMSTESAESQTGQPPESSEAVRNTLSAILPHLVMNNSKLSDLSPELFLRALINMSSELPKPFVLLPNKAIHIPSPSSLPSNQQMGQRTTKKLLDESVSDILSHLNNHHYANIASSNSAYEGPSSFQSSLDAGDQSSTTTSSIGVNSANEILNLEYNRNPFFVNTASIITATPKTKLNPPIEFHKSPWAKEPLMPLKNLHFKIKIV